MDAAQSNVQGSDKSEWEQAVDALWRYRLGEVTLREYLESDPTIRDVDVELAKLEQEARDARR